MKLYTTRIDSDHPNVIDTTFNTNGPGKFFAPTQKMVQDFKGGRITWEQYGDAYRQLLRGRWRKHQNWLSDFFQAAGGECAIACYCADNHCHRYIVAEEILPQIEKGIEYAGEWGKYPYEQALAVAQELVDYMVDQNAVQRIEIAGSLRRGLNWVGDIEIVHIPNDSWYAITDQLLAEGILQHPDHKGWGNKQRKFIYNGFKFDTYAADQTNWGTIYWIRTGPKSSNEYIMSWLKQRKAPLSHKGGYWYHGEEQLSTSEEEHVFELLGIPFVEPSARNGEIYQKLMSDPDRQWPDFRPFYLHNQQTLVDVPRMTVIVSDGRTYDSPLVVANIEEIERNLAEFRRIRDINSLIGKLYKEQEPKPLYTVPVIRERLHHSLDYLAHWVGRPHHLLWMLVCGYHRELLALLLLGFQAGQLELDMDDYKALYVYQWAEAGAKRQWEVYDENEWRFNQPAVDNG